MKNDANSYTANGQTIYRNGLPYAEARSVEAAALILNALNGPEDQAVALLREALREQRRWRSCQSIGACRQCVDDGVTLRIQTFLDALDATNSEPAK